MDKNRKPRRGSAKAAKAGKARPIAPNPLFQALLNRDIEELRRALNSGTDPSRRDHRGLLPLSLAANQGQTQCLRLLISARAEADGRQEASGRWTALMDAAHADRPECVEALIQAGASVDLRDEWGQTALLIAVGKDSRRSVELLLDAGAALDIASHEGASPEALARRGRRECLPSIQRARARIEAREISTGLGAGAQRARAPL